MLYNEIQNITSQYAQDKDAGLYTAILALNPERPFKSRGGKICKTTEDIADAIMAESAYYMEDLKKPNANLYLYLAATEGSQGKEVADAFCKYFKEYSPKRALTLVYLKLQGDGGIIIGSKHYQSPDELKHEKDGAQIALVKKAVTEKDSMLLLWLSDIYGDNLKSTDTFNNRNILEQFFLLGLLPFLSFKESNSNSQDALRYLIDSCPGRSDLFEIYAAQGLPLTGQNYVDKRTPIDYVVCNFNELSRKHGADTIRNLIRLLCKLGADVNEYSGDGTCPLINAYNLKDNVLVKLLLELGADENQYRVYLEDQKEQQYIKLVQTKDRASTESEYQNLAQEFLAMNGYKDTEALANDCKKQIPILKERREEQERQRQERIAEQERQERERIVEEKRKEQERREEQECIERERKAEQERKEEQSQKWRRAGRCGNCGGRFKYKFDHDTYGNEPWVDRLRNPVCKSCGASPCFDFSGYETKRMRAIWKIVEFIAAIVGSLMIHNFFILIPFIIIFIVPFFNGGFGKFIRITSIVAQAIISISIIIANISSPIIILGSIIIGSIILNLSCIMAYKESLFMSRSGWKILSQG